MATRTEIVLVCDGCAAEGDGVATHTLTVDRVSVEVDACGTCWRGVEAATADLLAGGRRTRRRRRA